MIAPAFNFVYEPIAECGRVGLGGESDAAAADSGRYSTIRAGVEIMRAYWGFINSY